MAHLILKMIGYKSLSIQLKARKLTMNKKNSIYIATSLDGFIADKNGGIAWLDSIAIPENEDMGYLAFMEDIDALVMGRVTFETVLGFDVVWPYTKPVFVLSNTLKEIPESHQGKAYLVKGTLPVILEQIHQKGYKRLYIDGGTTIQSFLKKDLIDEMIITTFPILLGGGTSLFADLPKAMDFELVESKVYFDHLLQHHFRRKREN
ncbi:dihydrofolate reductase family protein [Sediminicola sp. 1XM1-17]|uniref:dihydrofolate reductase family protein n=1 Tax=Sediminicola sp. 1XM1-17 TaxID=3127702 RepID=UPI003076F9D5